MRDCLLAPERTMTQCRDTDRTQRDTGRFTAVRAFEAAEATAVVGLAAIFVGATGSVVDGGGATSGCGDGVDATTTGATGGGVVSAGGRDARLSFTAVTARAIARSLSSGVPGGAFAFATAAVLGRDGGAFFEAAF